MSNQDSNDLTKDTIQPENTNLLIAEYNTLREEILKRIETQYQLTALTLTASGVILTIGLQVKNASILFIYPILTLFLAGIWMNNQIYIVHIGTYIREKIEPRAAGSIGWEHWLPQVGKKSLTEITAGGSAAIFISTELLTIFVGLSVAKFNLLEKALLALDILVIIISFALFLGAITLTSRRTHSSVYPHKDTHSS